MPAIHIIIRGKVQGVFFRATARKVARELNLLGWVRNTGDGNVECVIQGTKPAIEKFLQWCEQGPDNARVEDVFSEDVPEEMFNDFVIQR